jgi:hypothetical protein
MTFETPSEALVTPVQVLGSEANQSKSWVWVWGTQTKRIPDALTTAAERLRAIGEKERVRELTSPRVALTEADGETIALVASGLLNAPGYYRAPFQGGAMFVLLEVGEGEPPLTPERTAARDVALRMTEVFPRVVELLKPKEHRVALDAYARHHGFTLDPKSDAGTFRAVKDGEVLLARVGADGALKELELGN